MLLSLLTAAAIAQAPQYDAYLGLPIAEVQRLKGYATDYGFVPKVAETVKIGRDTLVMWSWPMKGSEGFGLQVYGPDGKFKTRLEDSSFPAVKASVCGTYVVGGGNTLRVWDAAAEYKLVQKRTVASLGQFATQDCKDGLLTVLDDTKPSNFLVPSLKSVDIRLGLSAATVASLNRSTLNHIDETHEVTGTLSTPNGDTLVSWARTSAYDPKGPREVGVQVYGKDGAFKLWLEDSAAQRPLLLCGRYLVGGDNTARVWDTVAGYKLLARKTLPLGEYGVVGHSVKGKLTCTGDTLSASPSGLRLKLPTLEKMR